ncbi:MULTISPECIES: PTS sugar transporter subunit IIB [Furfurilactobacillus]|uniref:PTS galactitol transporter subunit IIB n=1 Tax=Furfurilactobacillus rossiae TaxID=231049 RepID=A0A7C9IXX2_9LACO|nr:PTS sugar transporter subunit IIB [Furfurilactobacillus milii]MYV05482.1 PTS galactitol transporter subunit IIB [Furfurilactobacillus milii]
MKTLMVVCGSGVATSTVVSGKIKNWLADEGFDGQVKMLQSKISDEVNHIDDYDAVVSTTLVPDNVKDKIINGVPLLTGMNTQAVYDQIATKLELK